MFPSHGEPCHETTKSSVRGRAGVGEGKDEAAALPLL